MVATLMREEPPMAKEQEVEALAIRVATIVELVGHPLRLRILAWGFARPEERISAKVVTSFEDMPISAVSYHVRKLRKEGYIRPAGEARRRGAIEHYYLLTDKGRAVVKRVSNLADEFLEHDLEP